MRTRRLTAERLDDRLAPAQFGRPWVSSEVTASFVPDGTTVDGVKSTLAADLTADGLTTTRWQNEIRRAFQAWAASANLDIGFVADTGEAIGTPGRVQGDTRFGDIRIAARPIDSDVLAITTAPGFSSETRAGDIILNTNYNFAVNPAMGSGQYDLYTVFLQEIGHALSVGNNSLDTTSVMYETYQGTRTDLAASDRAAVRALYGSRSADAFEGATGNATLATAAVLPQFDGTTTLFAHGDVTRSSDVDVFSFTTPAVVPSGATVRLTVAGLSQLAGLVEVVDAAGGVVAASGPAARGTDVQVGIGRLVPNTRYFLRVTAPSGTGYRVGGYDLRVVYDAAAVDPKPTNEPVIVSDGLTNESTRTATVLSPMSPTTAQRLYRTYGRLESFSDVDYYLVRAPKTADGGPTTLNVHVSSYDAGKNFGGFAPQAVVYDAAGNQLTAEDLTYRPYRTSYQVRNVASEATVYVAVRRDDFTWDAEYELQAFYTSTAVTTTVSDAITLTSKASTGFTTLRVTQAQVMSMSVFGQSIGAWAPLLVTTDIVDASGKVVWTVSNSPWFSRGTSFLLTPGDYTIRIRAKFLSASADPLVMGLRFDTLTDPIGLDAPANPTYDTTGGQTMNPNTGSFSLFRYNDAYYNWLA